MQSTLKTFCMGLAASSVLLTGSVVADQGLAQQKNCMTCHQIEGANLFLGPSLQQIATHYQAQKDNEATIQMLVNKVKNGGDGVWNSMLPMMTPNTITDYEAKTLVKWILSLSPLQGNAANALPLTQ